MSPRKSLTRVTLSEVAEHAGVSIATVSKVLHGRGEVADSTRSRVEKSLRELSYVPVGRGTTPTRPHMVAAFDSFGNVYDTLVLRGIVKESERLDCRIAVAKADFSSDAAGWARAWKAEGTRAVLLVTTPIPSALVSATTALQMAVVAVDPQELRTDVPSIGATNWAGATASTNHLLDLNHTRIAFAGLDHDADFSVERFGGYRSAMERRGLSVPSEWVLAGHTSYEEGRRMGEAFVNMSPRPTAVVAVSDAVALGIIETAREAGISTPLDLSVVGFDDVQPAAWASPPLTTIRQPLVRMGELAVKTAFDLLRGILPASNQIQLATALIERGSTRSL